MKNKSEQLKEFVTANREILLRFYKTVEDKDLSFEEFSQKMFEQYLKMFITKEEMVEEVQ